MLIDILLLALGLVLLLGGGDIVVRGASALAMHFGVSSLVIGLTIVAFGTSAPELAINTMAVLEGNTEISFGNIIGSNIANIGLILGSAALIRPLTIEGNIIAREIPMMILASLLMIVSSADHVLRGETATVDRADGLVLLLIFGVFLFYTIGDVIRKRPKDPLLLQAGDIRHTLPPTRSLVNFLLFAGGLAILIAGGRLTVDHAVSIAQSLRMPKEIIGLTVIAVGTSLPELATSIIATVKGQTDIAIGNVVGSNIFNLLFINGICATIAPIPIPAGGMADLAMMIALSLLLLPLGITHRKKIVRWEGGLLFVSYLTFSSWRIMA